MARGGQQSAPEALALDARHLAVPLCAPRLFVRSSVDRPVGDDEMERPSSDEYDQGELPQPARIDRPRHRRYVLCGEQQHGRLGHR